MRIVHYPHPALRHRTVPVTHIDKPLRLQVGEMFDLMYEARGLGLAANQVAIPYQLLVMNMAGDPNAKDQERVFVNPIITERRGIMDGDEGCLSFPGLYAKVKRAKEVTVRAYDLDSRVVEVKAKGLEARAWQHELDHLNGVVFIERFTPAAKLAHDKDLKALESKFRQLQATGALPPDTDIERLLHDLVISMTAGCAR